MFEKDTSPAVASLNPLSKSLDLSAIRLPQNFGAVAGVKKVITTVPCRKPSNQVFIRVRDGEGWQMPAAVLQLKEDSEFYLVMPELYSELAQEVRPKLLYTAITRDGNPFLWPVNMPGEDGRLDAWSQSAHIAAGMAQKSWVWVFVGNTVSGEDSDILEVVNFLGFFLTQDGQIKTWLADLVADKAQLLDAKGNNIFKGQCSSSTILRSKTRMMAMSTRAS